MVKKYFINPESVEIKKGFENHLEKRDYGNTYCGRKEYGKYINYNAGVQQAKREIKMYGREIVTKYYRFRLCLSAIGKTEKEVRDIIRLVDGNIYRHEIDAVLIKLFSTSHAFNRGVDNVLFGNKTVCPYGKLAQYSDYCDWRTGVKSTRLAVKLHGREAIINTL